MANWLLIGPRGSRRIGWLQRALHDQGAPAAHVFAYETLLAEPARLNDALAQAPDAMLWLAGSITMATIGLVALWRSR